MQGRIKNFRRGAESYDPSITGRNAREDYGSSQPCRLWLKYQSYSFGSSALKPECASAKRRLMPLGCAECSRRQYGMSQTRTAREGFTTWPVGLPLTGLLSSWVPFVRQ